MSRDCSACQCSCSCYDPDLYINNRSSFNLLPRYRSAWQCTCSCNDPDNWTNYISPYNLLPRYRSAWQCTCSCYDPDNWTNDISLYNPFSRYCSKFNNLFIYIFIQASECLATCLFSLWSWPQSQCAHLPTSSFSISGTWQKVLSILFYFLSFICVNGQMLHWSINEDKLLA